MPANLLQHLASFQATQPHNKIHLRFIPQVFQLESRLDAKYQKFITGLTPQTYQISNIFTLNVLQQSTKMEISSETNRSKLIESVQRSAQLLAGNKHYEFAQKIKMLAQRKNQTQKYAEAEILLILGIKKMFQAQKVELNAAHDLIDSLLDLYESQSSLWKEGSPHQVFELLTKQQNPKNVEYFVRIVKKIAKLNKCPEIAQFLISSFQKRELFQQAESFLVHLQLSRVNRFLQKWHQKVDNQQYTIIVCRMALLKGLHYDFDQPMVLLSEVDAHNPFVKFTKFLVQAVQMKSRECFEKIGLGYKKFLEADSFFGEIYEAYGVKYFNNQKKGARGLI